MAGVLAGVLVSASASASASVVRAGAQAQLPAGSSLVGALASSTPMHLTIALQPRDPAALVAHATAVSDPSSPLYRHYLTTAQFARAFAPSSATVAAVRASLEAHGLRVGPLSAGGLSLPVTGDAGTLSRAFALVFDRIRLPSGVTAIVNSLAPALDRAIAPAVQAVIGLDSVANPQPLRASLLRPARPAARVQPSARPQVVTGGPQPCSAATTAAPGQSAYTDDQIASAYDFNGAYGAGDQGQGITVALYELEPYSPQDIAAYQACYGTSASITDVPVDGGAGSGAGTGEAAFDIEQVIGLAPKANIVVYTGPNSNNNGPGAGPFDALQAAVDQDKAQVISDSWGQCEPMEGAADAHAEATVTEQATVQGQTIFAASGDEGSEGCDSGGALSDTELATSDPATQPFVTGVGGTSLSSLGPPPTESVWNNGGNLTGLLGLALGATGGGLSSLWSMPSYQSGANPALGVTQSASSGRPCGNTSGDCRESPDVSADADPNTGYLIYYNGGGSVSGQPVGWQGTGGTSGSTPLWAAVIALADASKGCAGAPVGFVNPALYALAGSDYGRYFHDVRSGNNDLTASHAGLYPATTGYDLATGLGTPDASQLVSALCAASVRLPNPGTQSSSRGARVHLSLAPAGPQPAGVSYGAEGLPGGLRIDTRTGVVSGIPNRLGRYSVKLVASGPTSAQQRTTFTWVISGPPRLSSVSLSHVGSQTALLAFRVSAASGGPALGTITIGLPSRAAIGFGQRVAVSGAGGRRLAFSTVPQGATLAIRLRAPSSSVGITAPVIASPALRADVRRGVRPSISIRVSATDASGAITALNARARPSS